MAAIDNLGSQRFFTMILGRYNELALKSPKVRGRMEGTLVQYVIKMCEREGIQVLKGERLWGRLIFHFNPLDIPKALQIFPYLIGLHSFSPAYQLPAEFEIIKESVLKFADTYLCKGDRFAVRAHRVKTFPMKSSEMEREIGGKIDDHFTAHSKTLKVDLEHPDKTIFIEVREKIAHIYIEKMPTIWGGNPIEPDKAVIALWQGRPYDVLASHIFVRRGSIVLPIILQSNIDSENSNLEEIKKDLRLLAKFIPEPSHAIIINIDPLKNAIKNKFSTSHLYDGTLVYCKFYLILELLKLLNKEHLFRYFSQVLQFKGVVSSTQLVDQPYLLIGQRFTLPHFMPLTGLSEDIAQILDRRFRGEVLPDQKTEYILADTILEAVNVNSSQPESKNHALPFQNSSPIDSAMYAQIQSFFDLQDLNPLIEQILAERQVITIEGRILCD